MAANKSLGPNGFVVEFYTKFWNLIGHDYTTMVQESIQQGHFPHGINKGLIALFTRTMPQMTSEIGGLSVYSTSPKKL
jgi:hypothetical protein